MADLVLTGTGLGVAFGALRPVDGVDLVVREGECVGLIGANGAGKSTLLNLLSGTVRPHVGSVRVTVDGHDHDITRAGAARRARAGIARMFQTARLAPELSVRENVELGVPAGRDGVVEALGLPTGARRARRRRTIALEALERVGLADRAGDRAGELSLGQQRLTELARSLASGARLLLLDEPFAGLSRSARDAVADLLVRLRDDGIGLLLVEHDLAQVRRIADRLVAMDAGRVLASGDVASTLADPEVVDRYIGDIELEVGGELSGAAATPPTPPPATAGAALLSVQDLRVFHGAAPAVEGVGFALHPGSALALVGPNGAGKSTALRGIAGLLRAEGEVTLSGERIDGLDTPDRFARGLCFIPQSPGPLGDLTIGETLRLAWLTGRRGRPFDEALDHAGAVFPEIVARRAEPAHRLSGGQRQMLAVARSLMADPHVVLLDEPTAGLAPALVPTVAEALARLRTAGIAIVVVEHNLGLVRATCTDVLGLRAGGVAWRGPCSAFDTAVAREVFLTTTAVERDEEAAAP